MLFNAVGRIMVTTPEENQFHSTLSNYSPAGNPLAASQTSIQGSLAPYRIIPHHPKAGVNPIVDAAAYFFSLIGKLKQLKDYRHLSKLQQELIQEIQVFQNTVKAQGYNSEHILASRYALCATLDDIIQKTPWGSNGQWDQYSLLSAFHPDSASPERFFIILERIIKEPALYIEILELMYICLSLGFEGSYRPQIYNFEKIIQGLYQQIRAYRGDFPKSLSPFAVKPVQPQKAKPRSQSMGLTFLLTSCFIVIAATGLGYSLSTMVNQINQDLKQIGKTSIYETHA
jgi:type VI secretion system protein ImpK